MYMSAYTWDNDLVNPKEEQMKSIKITKQDQFGCERTFIVRHREDCSNVVLVEIDIDFGFESFRGVFDSEKDALDSIAVLTY